MIDLHIHSNLSTGSLSTEQILERAEQQHLKYYSITDTNHALAYEEINIKDYPNLIVGVEFTCSYQGMLYDLLAYDVNPILINQWFYKHFKQSNVETHEARLFKQLKKTMDKNNIKYSDHLKLSLVEPGIAKKIVYYDIIKHNSVLPFRNYQDYYRNFISNPFSPYYLDETKIYPDIEEVIELVKQASGKTFLAHPFEYHTNIDNLLELVIELELDGIEVFHPSSSYRQSLKLLDFCAEHSLLATAGTDYRKDDHCIPLGVHLHSSVRNSQVFHWIYSR